MENKIVEIDEKNTVTSILAAANALEITDEMLAEKDDVTLATEMSKTHGKVRRGISCDGCWLDCERQYIRLDGGAQIYTWQGFIRAVRTVYRERGALQAASAASLSRLQDIECRIHVNLQAGYASFLEVGRCLNEAKESKLVPHGEWEDWVRKNTGMSALRAQRLMKAAREVLPGSRLAELPLSKIQEILTLPEAEREPMAERVVAEDLTVKQLREEVARERRRSDQVLAKYNQTAKANSANMAEVERMRARMNVAKQEFEDARREINRKHREEMTALRYELEAARAEAAKATSDGISAQAQAEIDRLEAELKDAEAIAEHQAELRQQAQQALLDMQSGQARGDAAGQEDLTAEAVITAVRTFIGCVGYLPHSTRLAVLRGEDRQQVASHVAMIATWAEQVREALDASEAYVIEEA